MNNDLLTKSSAELSYEILRLRACITAHCDAAGHNLCWHHLTLRSRLKMAMDSADALRTLCCAQL